MNSRSFYLTIDTPATDVSMIHSMLTFFHQNKCSIKRYTAFSSCFKRKFCLI